jgi:hypothetical protein
MLKNITKSAFAGLLLICNINLYAQCKTKAIVKKCMPLLKPFQYDSYVVKDISFGAKAKKESVSFQVFSDEEYKLVFGQTVLPKEVGVVIYGIENGRKKILYFDESGRKSIQTFNFKTKVTGTYYIEYEIPPATASNQKGCFVVLIGIMD